MKVKFLSLLAAVFTLLCTTSCNDTSEDPTTTEIYYDIVTLYAQNDNGCTLIAHADANSNAVTYTSAESLDTDYVSIGERVLIAYTSSYGRYVSGAINLIGYQVVENGMIEEGNEEDTDGWSSTGIQPSSLWVTGNYLNMQFDAPIYNKIGSLRLVVDESTLSNSMPDVYLIYIADQVGASYAEIVASYDISMIWANSDYDGFVLHMNSEYSAMPNELEFTKTVSIMPVG